MSEINKLNGFNSNYGFYQKDDSESSVKKEAQPEQAKGFLCFRRPPAVSHGSGRRGPGLRRVPRRPSPF